MTETERLLMDIARRMPSEQETNHLMSQLKYINQSVNICGIVLVIIVLLLTAILVKESLIKSTEVNGYTLSSS